MSVHILLQEDPETYEFMLYPGGESDTGDASDDTGGDDGEGVNLDDGDDA